MTVKRRHFSWRKMMITYSDNIIACRHSFNVSINPNGTRSHGCFRLLVLSARHLRIINPGRSLTGEPPAKRRGDRGLVLPVERRGYRGVVPM